MGTAPMGPQLKLVHTLLVAALAIVILPLWASLGHTQQNNPLVELSGSWSGGGKITLSDGAHERIRCRASYDVARGRDNLRLALRCASDSYTFDFRANGLHSDGVISGQWEETSRRAAGTFSGSVKGNHIEARVEGQTFAALLSLTTHANRQSILIRSPGSAMSEVAIALSRR